MGIEIKKIIHPESVSLAKACGNSWGFNLFIELKDPLVMDH
jgi:hypothetical protein